MSSIADGTCGVLCLRFGVDDGTRTHDNRDHNPGLYQLSYVHRTSLVSRLACPAGLEPATLGLEGRCSIRLSYGHDSRCAPSRPRRHGGRESYVSGSTSVNFCPFCRRVEPSAHAAGKALVTSWPRARRRICYTEAKCSRTSIILHEITDERPAAWSPGRRQCRTYGHGRARRECPGF